MYRFEIYRDANGGYAWRLLAENGRVVAMSPDSFRTAKQAFVAVRQLQPKLALAEVREPRVAA